MAAFLKRMPDYTCVETIDRSVRRSASDAVYLMDRLRVDIAYIGNKEVYSWPGSAKFEEKRLAELVGNGLVSDGDFALHTGSLFTRDGAQITFAGNQVREGRNVARYDYRVPFLSNAWTLRSAAGVGRVGTRGSFWIATDTLDLVRLELDAQEIPADLMIKGVHVEIDYAKVRVHGLDISIPRSADTTLDEAIGTRDMNHVDFTGCREYHVQSSISFDSESGHSEVKSAALENVTFPPDLPVTLRLEQTIDSGTAAEGDLVTAKVEQDVKAGNSIIIPRGALVRGRIRRMAKIGQPAPHFLLNLEFTAIEFDNKIGDFTARLEHVDALRGTSITLPRSAGRGDAPGVSTLRIEGEIVFAWPALSICSAAPTHLLANQSECDHTQRR